MHWFWVIYLCGLAVGYIGTAVYERYNPGSLTYKRKSYGEISAFAVVAFWPLALACCIGMGIMFIIAIIIALPWGIISGSSITEIFEE